MAACVILWFTALCQIMHRQQDQTKLCKENGVAIGWNKMQVSFINASDHSMHQCMIKKPGAGAGSVVHADKAMR